MPEAYVLVAKLLEEYMPVEYAAEEDAAVGYRPPVDDA